MDLKIGDEVIDFDLNGDNQRGVVVEPFGIYIMAVRFGDEVIGYDKDEIKHLELCKDYAPQL